MNKEELIDYFISALGDNKYLGKILSIEQIRTRLNDTIDNLIYDDVTTKEGELCFCNPKINGKAEIVLSNKIPKQTVTAYIVHELLHALSHSVKQAGDNSFIHKGGIQFGFGHIENQKVELDSIKNEAINEGMTQALVDRTLRGMSDSFYNTENDIYKTISVIIGENAMLKKYFSSIGEIGENYQYLFQNELEKRYGKDTALEFSEKLIDISFMADKMLELKRLEENDETQHTNKEQITELKNEIYHNLENMLNKIIEMTPDIRKKVKEIMIPAFSTKIGKKYTTQIMSDFWEDSTLDDVERKELATDIIKGYLELAPYARNGMSGEFIVETYTNSGLVGQQNWNKKNALKEIIKGSSIGEIVRKIEKIQYKQVGNYYMILGDYKTPGDKHELLNGQLFDKEGNKVEIDRETFEKLQQRLYKKFYK